MNPFPLPIAPSGPAPASQIRAVTDGRDLLDALAEIFPNGEGWVQAIGFVDDVEVRVPGVEGDARRSFVGRYAVAQLSGPRGGPYGVTLVRDRGGKLELVAGILVRGRSVGMTAFLAGPAASATSPASIEPASGPAFPDSIQAGVDDEEEESTQEPERGDFVDHFAFGLCEVLNASGDRLMIRDVMRGGRVREIRTHLLVVHPPQERDGKRTFRLTRRG